MKTPVSSTASKADQAVEAVTITPVLDQGKIVIPAGVAIKGRIAETKPAVKADERAALSLVFTEIGAVAAKAAVIDVDNARDLWTRRENYRHSCFGNSGRSRQSGNQQSRSKRNPLLPEFFRSQKEQS